jgi:coiled-coil domain-containing protein 55
MMTTMTSRRTSRSPRSRRKAKLEQEQALAEDATVYDYDVIYDTMQEERAQSARARKMSEQDRQPKYMKNIMKMAEYKKREEERVTERVEARQRLKEKEEFGETDQFLTKAYKDKLKEWQKLDLEDAKQAAVEAAQDSKKVGMDSFYVNLMHNNVSMGNMVDAVDHSNAEPAGGSSAVGESTKPREAGSGGGSAGGQDGDGVELGIAGGSQMVFDDIANGAEQKVEQSRRRGMKRVDGKRERETREAKEAQAEEVRLQKKKARHNDESAVMSARERFLARKQAAAEAKALASAGGA